MHPQRSVGTPVLANDHARDARPKHKYSAEEFGLSPEGIAADFAFYHDAYKI
jgi:hypothetical protein